jgi:hypothetical protein
VLVPNDKLGYVPLNPLQDYRYILDRQVHKHYKEVKYAEVLLKLEKFWGLLQRDLNAKFVNLNIDDDQTWIPHFVHRKLNYASKEDVRQDILKSIREKTPTVGEPLDSTTYHHNKYWHY